MIWANACAHIALMENPSAFRNLSVVDLPRQAMRFDMLVVEPKLAVTYTIENALPQPAAVRLFNFHPEAIRE